MRFVSIFNGVLALVQRWFFYIPTGDRVSYSVNSYSE